MKINYKKFGFLPYQVKWLEDKSQIKINEKSRRIGMTYTQAFEDVIDCGVEGKFDVWFSSNNDLNGREYIRYCKDFAKALNMVVKDIENEEIIEETKVYSIEFKNGYRITALSSSPEQIHGKGGKIVLDEFARRDDQTDVWEAASPAALVWNNPIRIISTHNGKDTLFYEFVIAVKNGKLDWSIHTITFIDAVKQGLANKVFGKILNELETNEYVDKVKRSVKKAQIWAQQFMCEPQDESEAFMSYALIELNVKAKLDSFEELKNRRNLYFGLDIARKKNLTVLWVVEQVTPELSVTRHIRTMQDMSFPDQLRVIRPYLDLPYAQRMCLDYTGMGVGIGDQLTEEYGEGKIECVTFTLQTKQNIGFSLRNRMQDSGFHIPNDETIMDDFHSVKKETTSTGNIRLVADTNEDTGSHADYFWAAALANEAASVEGFTVLVKGAIQSATDKLLRGAKKCLRGFTKDFK